MAASSGLYVDLNSGAAQVAAVPFRNRIINGDMRIDQRNAGEMYNPLFGPDRFKVIGTSNVAGTVLAKQVRLTDTDIAATGGIPYAASLLTVPGPTTDLAVYMPFNGTTADLIGGRRFAAQVIGGTLQYTTNSVVNHLTTPFSLYLANEANVSAASAAANYLSYGSGYTFPGVFSVAFWVRATSVRTDSTSVIFATNAAAAVLTNSLIVYMNTNIYAGQYGGSAMTGPYIVAGVWYHVAVTYDGTYRFYFNGTPQGSTTGAFAQNGFMFGNSATGASQPFAGYIDDFRIYHRVLTEADVAAISATAQLTTTPTSGLVAYYPFDGSGSGLSTNIYDESGNGNTLTVAAGTYSYVPGAVGQAVALANTIANSKAANRLTVNYTQTGALTVSCWVYATAVPSASVTTSTIWSFGTTSACSFRLYMTYNATANKANLLATTGAATTSTEIYLNSWMHVVATWIPSATVGRGYLYVNGFLESAPSSTVAATGAGAFVLGDDVITANNYPFAGYIDDFRVYSRVLTPPEIAYLAAGTGTVGAPFPAIPSADQRLHFPVAGTPGTTTTPGAYPTNYTTDAYGNVLAIEAGSVLLRQGVAGSAALYFANEANVISVPTRAANYLSTTFTQSTTLCISGWIYLTKLPQAASRYSTIWAFGSTIATSLMLVAEYASATTAILYAATTAVANRTTTFTINANTWYHVSVNYIPGVSVLLRVNGGNFISAVYNTSIPASLGSRLVFGDTCATATTNYYPFAGYLNDFRIYAHSMARMQSAALYFGTAALSTGLGVLQNPPVVGPVLYRQTIEGNQIYDLAFGSSVAANVAVGCYIKNNTSNIQQFSVSLTNPQLGRSLVVNTPAIPPTTWSRVAFDVPGDIIGPWTIDNGAGLNVALCLGSGTGGQATAGELGRWSSNAYVAGTGIQTFGSSSNAFLAIPGNEILITGFQLEKGNTATPFEFRHYSIEVALCQRYWQQGNPTLPLDTQQHYYWSTTGGAGEVRYPLPVAMRISPTATGTIYISNASYSTNVQLLRLYTTAATGAVYFSALNAEF